MKKATSFWKIFLACMLALFAFGVLKILFFISMIVNMASSVDTPTVVNNNSILKIELTGDMPDRGATQNFASSFTSAFEGRQILSLQQVLASLEYAKNDPKIKGVYLNPYGCMAGWASLYELRNALLNFKESGKFIYAYSDLFTQKDYYIASVADSVFMHKETIMQLLGINSKFVSIKTFMEKIGVEMQIVRHGKFKSAVEPFMLDKMSEENRLQTQKYIDGIWATAIDGIAKSRNKSIEEMNAIADKSIMLTGKKACDINLIDATMTRLEFNDFLMSKMGVEKEEMLKCINTAKYHTYVQNKTKNVSKDKIAVIYAQGEIIVGNGNISEIGDNVCEAIHKAANDDDVKAIVLRVNSPGGSAVQSEFIVDELLYAKSKKPIVTSFGNYAASGGYYISCHSSYIYSNPNTLTGSIGVFGTIPNAEKLLTDKLGLKFEDVSTNEHSSFGSLQRPLNAYENDQMQFYVESTYNTFISHVADGRDITKERVDEIGQGRVWCGIDAKDIKLIDEFGGLNDAIAKAAELAEIDNYQTITLPKEKDFMETIFEATGQAKAKLLKNEMGEFYRMYEIAKYLKEHSGVQARLPYLILN